VLFPDRESTRDFAHEKSTKAPEGAAAGAGTGAVLGGALGWLAGIGALAIPGLGPFIAAGPIMAALGGMGAGAAVGGLSGALIGMGIPEYEAKFYEGKLKEGSVLIAVHTEDGDASLASHAMASATSSGVPVRLSGTCLPTDATCSSLGAVNGWCAAPQRFPSSSYSYAGKSSTHTGLQPASA